MTKLVEFTATAKGYYDDVLHDPETERHVNFMAPEDWTASWAERSDGRKSEAAVPVVSEETVQAEAILDAEADVGIPDIPANDSEDIPPETDDVNEATGVEVL